MSPFNRGPRVERRQTELGTERYCRGCDEWWPEDGEFFGLTESRDGRHTWCRACKATRRLISMGRAA